MRIRTLPALLVFLIEPGTLAFCEVRTRCVDGVCTADDTFALFESVCGQS